MAFDITTFRAAFPEFADTTKYPDAMLTFWSGIGDNMMNTRRWGDFLDQGLMLFVAHNAVLAAQNVAASVAGDNPGTSTGLIGSQSAGGVSVSIDTTSTSEQDAGNYNLTTFGQMFIRLSRIVGMGGKYV